MCLRIVMKTIMLIDMDNVADPSTLFKQVRSVMLSGHTSPYVILVGRVTGAMQWICFYLLISAL